MIQKLHSLRYLLIDSATVVASAWKLDCSQFSNELRAIALPACFPSLHVHIATSPLPILHPNQPSNHPSGGGNHPKQTFRHHRPSAAPPHLDFWIRHSSPEINPIIPLSIPTINRPAEVLPPPLSAQAKKPQTGDSQTPNGFSDSRPCSSQRPEKSESWTWKSSWFLLLGRNPFRVSAQWADLQRDGSCFSQG